MKINPMIKKIIDNPYLLLWLVPIPYIVNAAFIFTWGSVDLTFHDTYYIVSWVSLAGLVIFMSFLSIKLYQLFNNYLWLQALTCIQVFSTIAFAYLYCYLLAVGGVGISFPIRFYGEVSDKNWANGMEELNRFITNCKFIEAVSNVFLFGPGNFCAEFGVGYCGEQEQIGLKVNHINYSSNL